MHPLSCLADGRVAGCKHLWQSSCVPQSASSQVEFADPPKHKANSRRGRQIHDYKKQDKYHSASSTRNKKSHQANTFTRLLRITAVMVFSVLLISVRLLAHSGPIFVGQDT